MAHKKQGGKIKQGGNIAGKRLGVKVYDGRAVKPGMILVRQIGTKIHNGAGTKLSRDFTILATKEGTVKYSQLKGKSYVSVI